MYCTWPTGPRQLLGKHNRVLVGIFASSTRYITVETPAMENVSLASICTRHLLAARTWGQVDGGLGAIACALRRGRPLAAELLLIVVYIEARGEWVYSCDVGCVKGVW